MTTIAGVGENAPPTGHDTPVNRAVDALKHAGPPPLLLHVPDELDRDMAAGAVAMAIQRGLHYLTVRERMVLAAALLPEFQHSRVGDLP